MRRKIGKKISTFSIIYLMLAGVFNLISYGFDQIIVQYEDRIRNLDRNLQIDRNNLINLNSSINLLQDLGYEIDYESNKLLSLLGFNVNAYATFKNKDIFEKNFIFGADKVDTIKLTKLYKEKLIENIDQANLRIKNLYKVFESNFSSGLSYELMKDKTIFLEMKNRLMPTIPENYKEDYFKEGADKYQYYQEIYYYIRDFKRKGRDIDKLSLELQKNFSNKYADYFYSLEEFSSDQNNTNYFILLSIFSQILGLTFLLLLFRNLIYENI